MKKILIVLSGLSILGLAAAYFVMLKPNFNPNEADPYLYISTESDFEDLMFQLDSTNLVKNKITFLWVAQLLKYDAKVKPGKYRIKPNESNLTVLRRLRSGGQEAVKFTFIKFRTLIDLAGFTSKKFEFDSLALMEVLGDTKLLDSLSIAPQHLMGLFIPNTYEIYWNTSPLQFLLKMKKAQEAFWNEARLQKAEALGYNKEQLTIIASIVEEETNMNDEKSRVAGVYLNRLRTGMKLQADPTVKFALQDFALKRVRTVHTEFDSPYNTYFYEGLPPGPICTPSIKTLDAVLNAETHKYFYFCARSDFSGYHTFAADYDTHLKNAREYQRALNANQIN